MPDTSPTPVDIDAFERMLVEALPPRELRFASEVLSELRNLRSRASIGPDSERALQNVEAAIRVRAEQARSVDRRSQSAIGMLAAAEMIKRTRESTKESVMEQVTITLTDGQAARLDHFIKVTTDTNAVPLSREEYARQVVVDSITHHEAGDGTSGY